MTDTQALQRYARDRDPDAFRQLVLTHQRLVYATARRCLGNDADAQDATQETFLRLAKHAGRVRGGVAGWLHGCATHVSIDRIRSDSARRRREDASVRREPGKNSEVESGVDPTQAAEATELTRAVDRAIAELRPADRSVLVGHYLQGRKQVDLAREIGISQAGISKRIDRALQRVRKTLRARGVVTAVGAVAALLQSQGTQAQISSALTDNLIRIGVSGVGAGSLAKGGLLMATSWSTAKLVTAAAAVVLLAGGVTAVVVSREAPTAEAAAPSAPATPVASASPASSPNAEPAVADDPYAAADYGLVLKPADIAPKLTLMSRQTVRAEEIPFVVMPAYEALGRVIEEHELEPNGMMITMFREEPSAPAAEEPDKFEFTFAVPVASADEVPPPFTIEPTARFACVTYRHTGHMMSLAMVWPQVIAQAAYDGHELTGDFRLEGVRWKGPNAPDNVFSMQVGIVAD